MTLPKRNRVLVASSSPTSAASASTRPPKTVYAPRPRLCKGLQRELDRLCDKLQSQPHGYEPWHLGMYPHHTHTTPPTRLALMCLWCGVAVDRERLALLHGFRALFLAMQSMGSVLAHMSGAVDLLQLFAQVLPERQTATPCSVQRTNFFFCRLLRRQTAVGCFEWKW
jgi:hypothetical protein